MSDFRYINSYNWLYFEFYVILYTFKKPPYLENRMYSNNYKISILYIFWIMLNFMLLRIHFKSLMLKNRQSSTNTQSWILYILKYWVFLTSILFALLILFRWLRSFSIHILVLVFIFFSILSVNVVLYVGFSLHKLL